MRSAGSRAKIPGWFAIQGKLAKALVEGAGEGEAARGRLERGDAAAVRRLADAPAQVGADRDGHDPGRDERRVAPARAARRAVERVRVGRAAVDGVVGLGEPQELGQVALGDDDRSGCVEGVDDGCIGGGERGGERLHSPARRRPGQVERLLHGDGHAGEWEARRAGFIEATRGGDGLRVAGHGNGVQAGLDGLGSADRRHHGLLSKHLAPAHPLGELGGG